MAVYTKALCLLALACVASSAYASIETGEASFSRRALKFSCSQCQSCDRRPCSLCQKCRVPAEANADADALALAFGRDASSETVTDAFAAPNFADASSESRSNVPRRANAEANADATAFGPGAEANTDTFTLAAPNVAISKSSSDARSG